ncbi:putative transposase of the Rover family [Lachancea quebecensis]|uniref:Putative transposase of the Rover family n=1 Tax=Lachancea quebecensis TaxID=1654605 RepID=A0A0P1KZQ5_9SACH|nr:putative transposase of the Rover family [Lachancea quebecensis]
MEQGFPVQKPPLLAPISRCCDNNDQVNDSTTDKELSLSDKAFSINTLRADQSYSINLEVESAQSGDSGDDRQENSVSDDLLSMQIGENDNDTIELEEESSDVSFEGIPGPRPNEFFCQGLQEFTLNRSSSSTLRKIGECQAKNLRYNRARHDSTLQSESPYDHVTSERSESDISCCSLNEGSQDVLHQKMKRLESLYRNQYSINFDEYSINPCKIPNENYESNETVSDEVVAKKFESWLSTSPFNIWFIKYSGKEPYARCKYDHCCKEFNFSTNPTSFNLIKHLKTNHNFDYKKFYSKIDPKKHDLRSKKKYYSEAQKPFTLCASFVEFHKRKSTMIKELNFFVDNLLPFSLVESQSFRDILSLGTGKNKDQFTFSRKVLVKEIKNYHDQFEKQLRFTLERTSKVNILLDIWTSAISKSYLAILVSFCPNLDRLDRQSLKKDVMCRGFPNTHIIGLYDVSAFRYTGEYLGQALINSLEQYSLKHKVASITIDNAANNLAMLDKIELELTGDGVNEEGGVIRIHCLNHVLNTILRDIVKRFEKQNVELINRIDELTSKIKYNVFLSEHFRNYAKKAIPKHNEIRFVSRYRQFSSFINLTNSFKHFYLENFTYRKFRLKKEDSRLFLYQPEELFILKLFLKLTNLFFELTMAMQDDTLNNLPNGIQFYIQVHRFFGACYQILIGNVGDENLEIAGVQLKNLDAVREEGKSEILSTIVQSRSLFENYYNFASAQIRYWVAHILRPDMKIQSLSKILDMETEKLIVSKASKYVSYYIACHKSDISTEYSHPNAETSRSNTEKRPKKRLKALSRFAQTLRQDQISPEREVLLEWECYNKEPLDSRYDFIHYWMVNRGGFPRLCALALSFYYTKLSTADVERCFSISKRAIGGRFSLSSMDLKRTLILRNRLKCFGFREKLKKITSIEETSWAEDDLPDYSYDDENDLSDQYSCSE